MTADAVTAMVSYSWDDAAAAELLHEELALRGLTVFHDRCTFPASARIAHNMADAVRRCDAFVAYLTPSSLYLSKPAGTPRPAVDQELLPAIARWRRATPSRPSAPRIPVIVPLTHGLGDPRTEAPQQVFAATGEDISSLWTPITLDQSSPAITQREAAAVADHVIAAVLDARGVPDTAPLELLVASRSDRQPPAWLTVDASALLGGPTSRPGDPADWDRLLSGLRDLQSALARATTHRQLHVVAKAHLSACLAAGRVFNQAAGWQLTVAGRHGDTNLPAHTRKPRIVPRLDPLGGPGPMTVEIDLLNTNITDLANATLRTSGQTPQARLQIHRVGSGELWPAEVGAAAAQTAEAIRHHIADLRPHLVQVFCASPADFAVLVGHRLTSLHADLQFHERDGDHYTPVLRVGASVP